MGAAVVFACFLPNEGKRYVLEEIVTAMGGHLGPVQVYCGVQHGSHPDTEAMLRELGPEHDWHFSRVPAELAIDSDAAAYVAALGLLRDAGTTNSLCYFIHTKSITSGNDDLRRELLAELFAGDMVSVFAQADVGSWGPRLTITRDRNDRQAMSRWLRFVHGRTLPVVPYFYSQTLWVARGECVTAFLERVDPAWFSTPVADYSDRYFAERDLPHFVDAVCGMRPTFGRLGGNHSTDYHRTRQREVLAHLAWWRLRTIGRRKMRGQNVIDVQNERGTRV